MAEKSADDIHPALSTGAEVAALYLSHSERQNALPAFFTFNRYEISSRILSKRQGAPWIDATSQCAIVSGSQHLERSRVGVAGSLQSPWTGPMN